MNGDKARADMAAPAANGQTFVKVDEVEAARLPATTLAANLFGDVEPDEVRGIIWYAVSFLPTVYADIVYQRWLGCGDQQPTYTELEPRYGIGRNEVKRIEGEALTLFKQTLFKVMTASGLRELLIKERSLELALELIPEEFRDMVANSLAGVSGRALFCCYSGSREGFSARRFRAHRKTV
ncbi:hypothetical protein ACFL5U_03235, partial [Candidatus Margulisiibacteriota bacterium]